VFYNYPGVQTFFHDRAPDLAGGARTRTACSTWGDGFLMTVCSQLPPEENPGQLTTFMDAVLGIERGNPDVQELTIDDYKLFKAAGICAPRMDDGSAIFQSGITSVAPLVHPNLKNIARRRMADFIQDSMAIRLKAFGKKMNQQARRAAVLGEIRAFSPQLLSPSN
jgi:hypothetical protein